MTDQNFIIGRGEIRIDGRYIGNSPSMMFMERHHDAPIRIKFDTDNMSKENMELYFAAQKEELKDRRFTVEYKSFNPAGKNIDFYFGRVELAAGEYEFKGEHWQRVQFIGLLELDVEGTYYQMVERPASFKKGPSIEGSPLLQWAVDSWKSQVKNRPLVNIHRRALDSVWRQVIRWAGGDPEQLIGPDQTELAQTGWPEAIRREKEALADLEEVRKAVFGDVGDEPDVYKDYDRCSELAGKMRAALAIIAERHDGI